VLGVGKVNFRQGPPAIMLKYISDVSLDDPAALAQEADSIWEGFRADANKAEVTGAILSANSPPTGGIVQQGRAYNFVYEKDGSGTWSRVQHEK
jgi:hypothetical protein